jgi:hypothetical protein
MNTAKLRGMQWAARGTLVLGVSASVSANVLHAEPNAISQTIAGWPPLALLITVELVSRIPTVRRGLGLVRIVAATGIAAIAAWVSYWHMAGVASRYGEVGASPYLLPISVDGLIVVASVSLVELSRRLRADSLPTDSTAPATAAEVGDRSAEPEPGPLTPQAPTSSPTTTPLHSDDQPAPDTVHDADHDPADEDSGDEDEPPIDLAPDLVPLLPAAREARDELAREGHTVSRDALARRLRENGHAIRNNRVSELLHVLKKDPEPSTQPIAFHKADGTAVAYRRGRDDFNDPEASRREPMAG